MANDISSINSSRAQQSGERSVGSLKKDQGGSSGSASTSTTSSGSDKVSLTDTAARLKALEQQLTQQSDIDNSKVEEVQNAMSNGEYKVDPKRVADKMLNFEASLK